MARVEKSSLKNPLSVLQIFDRLEIGPVKIEEQRLVAPYRLYRNKRADTTHLIYKYQEKVFDPDEPDSRVLANIIAAQVALNYGLFCRHIVFHGEYDGMDRAFIRDMMENTSREIYVKKFLEPNPFLLGQAAHLAVLRRRTYSQAQVLFPDPVAHKSRPWNIDPSRHVVLSSGGKDSLLSYGLLNEIGREVHPIFINESGRHWYTALNSFRYFDKNIPHTARVWTNSDRVFNWMLRHMPFIRRDFATLRSDEYPIRLWTVAVFLFGALPLMRVRGIGRLIIGDEFDTTVRSVFQGISHYNGLYDQSRYFDCALSRFFQRKGYAINQFSIIRPLSEVLIEKILSERYVHLLRHQTSCHATHLEGDRVRPCGRCEKCRRIVCMLTALGSDPRHCGYTDAQIRFCLRELEQKNLHQESESVQQLLFLLHKKGFLRLSAKRLEEAIPHPEIMNLRFDAELSPVDGIPMDLREPLYRLFAGHAEGVLERKKSAWLPLDLGTDPRMKAEGD